MINIAISKGRICKSFINTLLDKQIIKEDITNTRNLKINIDNEYNLLIVKSTDVIDLINLGYSDIGIVGSDVIEEKNINSLKELYVLEFAKCYFALSSLPNMNVQDIKTIATKYPNISRQLLKNMNLECNIVTLSGSLEIAPLINYADAIIDIVETGNTLKENGLVEIKRLKDISTKIIYKNDNNEIKKIIKKIN